MAKFYDQIKGRQSSGSNREAEWTWPPVFSCTVEADNRKPAKAQIDEPLQHCQAAPGFPGLLPLVFEFAELELGTGLSEPVNAVAHGSGRNDSHRNFGIGYNNSCNGGTGGCHRFLILNGQVHQRSGPYGTGSNCDGTCFDWLARLVVNGIAHLPPCLNVRLPAHQTPLPHKWLPPSV
ncbi:hypothetical protein ABFE88_07865 [Pseudomonas sichuanensis]|uniref:Uncharacterized protein n=1 Tax=Pseudomonas sichuanensis TaxID=2213015 RepID=A0ABV0DGD2_9PSED